MKRPPKPNAFTLVELLVSMAVVAVLIGLLMPMLTGARAAGYRSVCATNQRQLGIAFVLYIQDNKDTFPQYALDPDRTDWKYGGAAVHLAGQSTPTQGAGVPAPLLLDANRPINRYVSGGGGASDPSIVGGASSEAGDAQESVRLFFCPADGGVFGRASNAATGPSLSILGRGTCFREYGTSYRANAMLLNSTAAGIDDFERPLKMADIATNPSRVLLLGDTAWYYATLDPGTPEHALEASWHRVQDAGNMLAVDGSTRFVDFAGTSEAAFTLRPRGD